MTTQNFRPTNRRKEINLTKNEHLKNYEFIKKSGKPTVIIGQDVGGFNRIVYNGYLGIKMVLEYLWKNGKRKIAYAGVERSNPAAGEERYRAYKDFTIQKNIKDISYFGNQDYYSGYDAAKKIMKYDVDAVVCGTDALALGVKKFLREVKRTDVAMTGVGENELVRFMDSKHIGIKFDYTGSGRRAVNMIFTNDIDANEKYVCEPELVSGTDEK